MRRGLVLSSTTLLLLALILPAATTANDTGPALRQGMTGPAVTELQELLGATGFDPGPADGIFGPRTAAAVAAAQDRFGLPADQAVSPEIPDRLRTLAAGKHQVQPGETLGWIAGRYGFSLTEVVAANDLADPDLILVGQAIALPPNALTPTGQATAAPAGPAPPPGPATAPAAAAPPAPRGSSPGEPAASAPAAAAEITGRARSQPAEARLPGEQVVPVTLYAADDSVPAAARPVAAQPLALTFNGGPDPNLTPLVLQLLAQYDMRATFFVRGESARNFPELVRAMAEGGHEVANRGWDTTDLTAMSPAAAQASILATRRAVEEGGGGTTLYFRPPGGRLSGALHALAGETGHRTIMWTSIGVRDQQGLSAGALAARTAAASFPGAIIMLHDNERTTVVSLPQVLSEIHRLGYRSVTLTELLQAVEQR